MTPPVITLDESVEIPETFPSLQSAIDFYMTNTEQEDDCTLNEDLTKTYTTVGPNTCGNVSIEITVCTPCLRNLEVKQTVNGVQDTVVDGEGRPCQSVTYEFIVDDKAPIVTCGFHKLQDIYFVRDSNFIPDALHLMAHNYETIGALELAASANMILKTNFPNYVQRYKLN